MITVPGSRMRCSILGLAVLLLAAALSGTPGDLTAQEAPAWPMHSPDRPQPRSVEPGAHAGSVAPPSDAIVLFDGGSLAEWHSDGEPARWRTGEDYFEVKPGTGGLSTRRNFGSVQLHIEWMAPCPPQGSGQDRGNSGVFMMSRYEVQILDSWQNPTYPDGQAASLYGQHPPLVNASRPPGEWQSYDIIFRRPLFDAQGGVIRPARMTVLHNGVVVHDGAEMVGPTSHQVQNPYEAHDDALPILLQDHGARVRFRNVWVREISDAPR
jgi:hypothetical protein